MDEAIASAELAGANEIRPVVGLTPWMIGALNAMRAEPLPCEDCGRPSTHMLDDIIPQCDSCTTGERDEDDE